MKTEHIEVGRIGEEIAVEYLCSKGYEIIEKNYSNRYSEIDIIAKAPKTSWLAIRRELVFVEVRTKTNEARGTPEESIDFKKKKKLKKNAESYIAISNWMGPARIDAICIILNIEKDQEAQRLDHYENIIE